METSEHTGELVVREPEEETVAVLCEILEGEAQANARLVAASPKMLAMLLDAVRLIENSCG